MRMSVRSGLGIRLEEEAAGGEGGSRWVRGEAGDVAPTAPANPAGTFAVEMSPSGLSQVGPKCPGLYETLMSQAVIECGCPWTSLTWVRWLCSLGSLKGCPELKADH